MAKEGKVDRIGVAFLEKKLSDKWFAEKLGKSEHAFSRWTANKIYCQYNH